MGQDGDALVVWHRNGAVQARSRSAAGALGAIQTVATLGVDPKVAVDTDGDALIVWDGGYGIEARSRTAAGALGVLQDVSGISIVGKPDLGLDAAGNAFIAWERHSGVNVSIVARRRTAAGVLVAAFHNMSATVGLHENPRVAMAGTGDLVVAWEREGSNTQDIQIQARGRSAAGAFTPIATLNADNQEADYHQAGIDADGDALVIWSQTTSQGRLVQASTGP
jgi:hypothetical protein